MGGCAGGREHWDPLANPSETRPQPAAPARGNGDSGSGGRADGWVFGDRRVTGMECAAVALMTARRLLLPCTYHYRRRGRTPVVLVLLVAPPS